MAAVATATVSKNVVLHVFSPSASILVLRLRKTRAAFQGQARLPLHNTNGTLQHRGILLDIVDIAKASDVVGLRTRRHSLPRTIHHLASGHRSTQCACCDRSANRFQWQSPPSL